MDSSQADEPRPWLAVGHEITELLTRVDPSQFDQLITEFSDQERRWFLSGQGRSGLAAEMGAMRLMHLGRVVHYVGEATAPSVRAGDGLLLVSGSGETAVTLKFASVAKAEGARLVVLTTRPASTLAQMADALLVVPVAATAQFGGSLFEQSCIVLLDALVMALARRLPNAHGVMLRRHTNLQ